MGIINDGHRWKIDFKGRKLGYICNVCGKRFADKSVQFHYRVASQPPKDIAGISHGLLKRVYCEGDLVPAVIAREPDDPKFGDEKGRLIVPEKLPSLDKRR